MEIVSKIRWADYTAGTAGPRGRSDWLGDRSGRSRSWIYPWKPGDWQMLLPPPPLSSCSPSARTRPSLSTVRAPLVCHPPSSPWLEKPLPLPPDSVDPAAPPRLLAPSPPPSPVDPSAPPGSLIPPAPPWSGINPPTPLDSSLFGSTVGHRYDWGLGPAWLLPFQLPAVVTLAPPSSVAPLVSVCWPPPGCPSSSRATSQAATRPFRSYFYGAFREGGEMSVLYMSEVYFKSILFQINADLWIVLFIKESWKKYTQLF